MNYKGNKIAKWVLVGLLTLTAILLIQTKGCKTQEISIQRDTIVTFDTIYFAKATKPKIIYSEIIDTFKIIDTIEVVKDYQTLKIYADSLKNDTISISIRDTIFKNAILGRNIAYTLRLPTRTITNTITREKSNSGLYLSASVGREYFGGTTFVKGKYFGSLQYGNGGLLIGGGVKIF